MPTAIYSELGSASHRPTLTPFKRRLYIANGWGPMGVWDGIEEAAQHAGIEGPSTATGAWAPTMGVGVDEPGAGEVTAGTHKFRFRYMNSRTGYVSNPSNEVEVTAAGALNLIFVIGAGGAEEIPPSVDPKVDTIVLEATLTGPQDTYFKAAEAPNAAASVEFDMEDVDLAEFDLPWPSFDHNLPPYAKHLLPYADRLWAFGQVRHADGSAAVTNGSATVAGTAANWTEAAIGRFFRVSSEEEEATYEIASVDVGAQQLTLRDVYAGTTRSGAAYLVFSRNNEVFFSHPAYPEGWPSNNAIEGLANERIRAMVGFGSGLMIFGLKTAERFAFTGDPRTTGAKRAIPGARGALGQRVVVVQDNVIYSMDRSGFWAFDGDGTPRHISRPIDRRLRAVVDFAQSERFFGVYLPDLRAIRWYVVRQGEDRPQTYFEYEIDRRLWGEGRLDVAFTAGELVPEGEGVETMVGDENGHTWWDDTGTSMGGDPDLGVNEAGPASSAEIVQVTGPLPVEGVGMAGVTLYHPASGEVRVVESNTLETLTLIEPLSADPTPGDVILLGRMRAKLKSKAFEVRGFPDRMRGIYLWVHFVPLESARLMRVRFYRDFELAAHAAWPALRHAAGKLLAEGVVVPQDGETDFLVRGDAPGDGVVKLPLGLEATRALEVEFEVEEPGAAFEILGYRIAGEPSRTQV